ncbi:DUF4386 domain-containing protein [Micromonospora sp. DT81.3]|uniref:DUF4386 domain-containing protein n=1 Tax=Micromonospora sp. DT81.3 TaxID=3416523 RepID=UPI003CECE92E
MTTDRRASITTGVLFIIATVAVLAAAAVVPALTGPAALSAVGDQPTRVAVAALLYLVAAGTSVGIAIVLYPALRRFGPTAALGSVIFRTIEAVFYTLSVVMLLSVLPLARTLTVDAELSSSAQIIAQTLLDVREHSDVVAVMALSMGALLYYTLLYRSRLVPRWLSGWGIVGTLLILTAAILALVSNAPVTGYAPLILPILIQEMVLAVWLVVKGFNTSASAVQGSATSTAVLR